jgi:hypothetical protein
MLHNNIEMLHNSSQKSPKKFVCESCDYKCSKKSDFEKHLLSIKHKSNENGDKCNLKFAKNVELTCNICNKIYKSRTGLWRHKKICNSPVIIVENTIVDSSLKEIKVLTELVIELVKNNTELQKQNQDFQKQVLEICKSNNTTINNSTNNSHNKTFNLQLFLNEECKDAMNMSEFINSLQVKLSDLENMGTLGYTEGISKIILNEMNVIDQNKRPVHCTDIKRDILYVKDEDKWEKEQPEYPKLKQAIRKVEQKNFGLMGDWQAEHPDYKDSTTHENTEYLKLVSQTMGGTPENMHKVIKRIAKEVIIDK